MNDTNLKCVFCGETNLQKTVKFRLETLQKCINVLEYRRSKPVLRKSRTTYDNMKLSKESSLNEVYHAQCYKLFTAIKIPRDVQYSQQQQIKVEYDNASEVAVNSSESHAPASGECSESHFSVARECSESQVSVAGVCSKSHVTVDSTSTGAANTSTDEAREHSNIQQEFEDFNDSFNTGEPVTHNDSASQTCFICEKQRKRYHGREVRLAVSKLKTIENLKNAVTEQNDVLMLEKLSSFSDNSDISYHKCCKDQYLRDIYRNENSEFLRKRKVYNTAYTILCDMLEERVVKNNECFFFDYIKKEYQKLLEQQYSLLSSSVTTSSFSDRHLERKLMKTFVKKIKIIYTEKKKFLAPFSVLENANLTQRAGNFD